MNHQADRSEVRPGEFPFPLRSGPNESRFLVWLRNHSNYLAVYGFLDYLRMGAVLVRGILINNLVILPILLAIALGVSLAYSGLLNDWQDQGVPESSELRNAYLNKEAAAEALDARKGFKNKNVTADEAANAKQPGKTAGEVMEDYRNANRRFDEARKLKQYSDVREKATGGNEPISFHFSKRAVFPDTGWVERIQDSLPWFRLTPPFLLTPLVSAFAAVLVLLFPVVMMMKQIAGYHRSLATGSDSSIKWRDRYERFFGLVLLGVLAVALIELLPLIVYFYHQLRLHGPGIGGQWKQYFAAATTILGALSAAPKLLSLLSGIWRKLAMALVAVVGLLVPLTVIVLVCDFLVYESMPLNEDNKRVLFAIFLVTPALFSLAILLALLVGTFYRTFSRGEIRRLLALFFCMTAAHLVLAGLLCLLYSLAFYLHHQHPELVPDLLLALYPDRGTTLETYGDLAFYFVLGGALEIWLFCWLTVDINLTSIHGLYRDRLASAYLLGVNASGDVDIEEDVDLNELCCHAAGSTAPYHLINVALNLQGSKDIGLRDRQSDFFIFSKKFIGGERTGYCRSATMEHVFPHIDLASAMAISAAAASPNMGRGTNPALVAFMTMINVRLGVWIPNPGRLEEALAGRRTSREKEGEQKRRKRGFTFAEVFTDELTSVQKRWEQLLPGSGGRSPPLTDTPSTAHGLAGIAFSGGGIRSATINLGIAQVLHHAGIFRHFDYMSTVSGGGYLGSSISTLMRYKTKPFSEIAGRATIENTASGEKIVTVTPSDPSDQAHRYHYSKDAELEVKNDERIKAGDRLVRRPGAALRSEITGTVSVDGLEGEPRNVRVSGQQPGESRQYRCEKFDELAIKSGDVIAAGDLLVKKQSSFGNRFAWRVRPRALLGEMTMRLDETHRWVNLSDGGHIENLATIELLRRHCKLIVIGDGEADPNLHFNGLATLMRTARLDLGVQIDICLDELRLDASRNSKAHFTIGKITYPGDNECGYLLYLKSSYTGDEDDVIGEYRRRNPDFPHEPTADQFFDEGQFEAYRALGQHIGEKAIEALAPNGPPDGMAFPELFRCIQAFWEREEKKTRETAMAPKSGSA